MYIPSIIGYVPSNQTFQELLASSEPIQALGGYDALTAVLAERAGADLVYMSGSSVSASVHGGPDVGLTTMTEMVERARQMVGAVRVPVFCDADTGYGNPINVRRTVQEFERAGAAAIHIEDQTYPKRCGHFEGTNVIPAAEMTAKIQAATDARDDPQFGIVARTDATAVDGVEEAIQRAKTYHEAGADALFVEAPESKAALSEIGSRLDFPLIANMTEGGKTPIIDACELGKMGYDIILYPATAFKAVCEAVEELYTEILETGTQADVMDTLVSWEERNEITGLERINQLESRYSTD